MWCSELRLTKDTIDIHYGLQWLVTQDSCTIPIYILKTILLIKY